MRFKYQAIEFITYLSGFLKKSKLIGKTRDTNQQNILSDETISGVVVKVDEVTALLKKDFILKYYLACKPVVIKDGAKDWECTKKWDLNFLKEEFGTERISNYISSGLEDRKKIKNNDDSGIEEYDVKISDLIDGIEKGSGEYIRFSPFLEKRPHLLKMLNHNWLKRMRMSFFGVGIQSFIGSKGRVTPLHSASMSFFFIMVSGKKKWTLVPTSENAILQPQNTKHVYNFSSFSLKEKNILKKLKRYECVLEEGDILFVPAWIWHEVENLTHSWGVSYRFSSLYGFFSSPVFMIRRIFFSKPSILKVLVSNFISGKKSTSITPKFYRD